jgi:hypothetical protein
MTLLASTKARERIPDWVKYPASLEDLGHARNRRNARWKRAGLKLLILPIVLTPVTLMLCSLQIKQWYIGVPVMLTGIALVLPMVHLLVSMSEKWMPDLYNQVHYRSMSDHEARILGLKTVGGIGKILVSEFKHPELGALAAKYAARKHLTAGQAEVYDQLTKEDYTGTLDQLIKISKSLG